MNTLNGLTLLTASALTLLPSAEAKVVVDPMFTDHLVLQRDVDIPVWGKADRGETVTVEYLPSKGSKNSPQKVEAETSQDGRWRVVFRPLSADSKGGKLIITGDKTEGSPTVLEDLLVGEVWLGSGQSNMAYGTRHYTEYDPELKQACEAGPHPMLRVYVDNTWQIADTENVRDFSALLFSFGHVLQQELDVPVGLMVGAVNGSHSVNWLTEEMANDSPEFVEMFKKNSGFGSIGEMEADRKEKLAKFNEEVKKADPKDRKRMRFSHPAQPGARRYSAVERYVPYSIRGVLWDQGESGTGVPGVDQYTVMQALIAGWRKTWGMGDFPFLHVQKPSGGGCAWEPSNLTGKHAPLQWEPLPKEPLPEDRKCAQNLQHVKMGTIKNAPLVTASDLSPGVHPVHKYSYGMRACRVALGSVYGRDIVTCGPTYKSHAVRGDEIEISFDHVGKGLAFRQGDKLQGFEIAGDDLNWQWADSVIKGDKVIVSSGKVTRPQHVRYAFNQTFPWANLFNKDGMPALMFTSSSR